MLCAFLFIFLPSMTWLFVVIRGVGGVLLRVIVVVLVIFVLVDRNTLVAFKTGVK